MEFCQGAFGAQTLQKILCASGSFGKDRTEAELFVAVKLQILIMFVSMVKDLGEPALCKR